MTQPFEVEQVSALDWALEQTQREERHDREVHIARQHAADERLIATLSDLSN